MIEGRGRFIDMLPHVVKLIYLFIQVVMVPSCSTNYLKVPYTTTLPVLEQASLQHCTKDLVDEYHLKTVYECRNVTKTHCTTLWRLDDKGQKVWAGNEDDCRDVTWEECEPVVKEVPFPVPVMNCVEVPYPYVELVNVTLEATVSVSDCTTTAVQACSAAKVNKCTKLTYQRCAEVPDLSCAEARIPVPAQQQVHKQWCLFDQDNNDHIDFDKKVKEIIGEPDSHEEDEDDGKENEEEDEEVVEDILERNGPGLFFN